jgi:hypothetical protein
VTLPVGGRQPGGGLGCLPLVEVEYGDRGSFAGEPAGDPETDAARGSGDDGDASVEATHVTS